MIKFKKKYQIELAETLGQQHWYKVSFGKKLLGYFPSSTTILQAYPFSQQLVKWVADQGYEEAQRIKSEAGIRGTKIHSGVESLLQGSVLLKDQFSLEEWSRLYAFTQWHKEYNPKLLASELPLFSRKYGYAGRTDQIFKISDKIIVCDVKTSASIYDHFPLQVASYAEALEETTSLKVDETAILQLGAKNKAGYRFVIYPDWHNHFKTFLNVFETWKYDNNYTEDFKPPVLDLPNELKL